MLLKRKKKKNKILSLRNFLLLAIFLILFFIISYSKSINSSSGKYEEVVFVVERGQSVRGLIDDLKNKDLIRSDFYLKIYLRFFKDDFVLREGTYVLNRIMSPKDMVEELNNKASFRPEKSVRLIEGWNLRDYAKAFSEAELIKEEDFFSLTGRPMLDSDFFDFSSEFSFLEPKPDEMSLEGYLFPDTYRFFEDSKPEDIVRRILRNFDQKLTKEMRDEIEKQGKTIHEIVTMASIIEKEVQSKDDMKMVSGIFWNRIERRQALESCATLAYILGVNKAIYSYEDTRIPSVYNTYINRNLPPGPIANPGIRAIEAAIYPTENDYLFFLSRPDTKETIFSRTYNEHLNNRNKYLR